MGLLKIFILAGQSNMEGRAHREHLLQLVLAGNSSSASDNSNSDNEYRNSLWNGTSFRTREDGVFYISEDYSGKLTVSSKPCFGPELGFGWAVADALHHGDDTSSSREEDQQSPSILLIKTAWGGKSLARDFRPPSSGDLLPRFLSAGKYYRKMVSKIHSVLARLDSGELSFGNDESLPLKYELSGFVWFQGWKDSQDSRYVQEYRRNLSNLIRDVRHDLSAPDLPFVVGELGQGGLHLDPTSVADRRHLSMRQTQETVTLLPEFLNNTLFVRTAPYVISNEQQFDGKLHYYGRADTVFQIGKAFGNGMLQLMESMDQNGMDRSFTHQIDPTPFLSANYDGFMTDGIKFTKPSQIWWLVVLLVVAVSKLFGGLNHQRTSCSVQEHCDDP